MGFCHSSLLERGTCEQTVSRLDSFVSSCFSFYFYFWHIYACVHTSFSCINVSIGYLSMSVCKGDMERYFLFSCFYLFCFFLVQVQVRL